MPVSRLAPVLVLGLLAPALRAQETFRIMSYNIRSAAGLAKPSLFGIDLPHIPDPLRHGLGGILDVMQSEAVDLVGVQEIQGRNLRSFLTDQAKWLGDNLGFEHAWDEAKGELFGAVDRTGDAILCRWKVLEHRSWRIEAGGEGLIPRVAQLVRFEHPDFPVPVNFVNTHMNGRGELEGAARMKEMEGIAAVVRDLPGPMILTGDFNVDPDAPQVRFVVEGGLGRPMQDAAAVAPGGSVLTSPTDEPRRRIDYVFVSGELEVVSCRAVTEARRESDHLPLVAVVRPRSLARVGQVAALPAPASGLPVDGLLGQ